MPDIVNIDPQFMGTPAFGVELYQLPSEGAKAIGDIINATWNTGLTTKEEFSAKITEALTGFLALANTPTVTPGSVTAPVVTEPVVSIPATADVGDIMGVFDTKYLELVALLSDKLVSFRATYFPDEGALYAAAEASLQAAITSGSYLPATVQQQIWGDDHARITADKQRAQDAAVAQFAARRFPLPPDVAAAAVLQIEQKAQDELAESSRKIAILSVEQYRYVIEKAIGLRGLAMDAAIKYITALASGPEMASRLVGVGYDAQSKLIGAAASFFNARTAAAELTSKVNQYNNTIEFEGQAKNQMAELTIIEDKLKALLAEAQTIGQIATALLNNVHASASLSVSGGTNGSIVSS